jgi:hypothetical protein
MSQPDISVGLDVAAMDAAAREIYRSLYPRVFTGSEHVDHDGLKFDVSWDVTGPPRVDLTIPPEGPAILREHLADFTPPGEISNAAVVDAYLGELEDTAFQLLIDSMTMTIAGEGHATVPVTVTIFIHVESTAGKLNLVPVKAIGTTPSPDDEWVLNQVILPEAMKLAHELFPGIDLPPLRFGNIALTAPVVTITPTHAVAMANLEGSAAPTPPYPSSWPGSPFFVVLSDAAKLRVAQDGTAGLRGKRFGSEGSVDIGIGDAHFGATAIINNVAITSTSHDGSPAFAFDGDIGGNVNAGIKIGCTTFGVNYTLYAKPNPHGVISLRIDGRSVSARTAQLDVFVLLITPDGSPIEWLLSALTTPLLQAVVAAFSPVISQAFNGISFPVMDLPDVPIDLGGVRLTVTPTDGHFGSFAGLTTIEGQATITGG